MKKWLTKPKTSDTLDNDTREVILLMSSYNAADFNDYNRENPKVQFEVKPLKKPVSEDLRAFYFGAVIPEIRKTCDEWKNLSSDQMHEVIKKMFFYFETYNPITKRTERFGRTVMADNEWNNSAKAMQFLDVLREYLANCGLEFPDPDEYKNFRDSAPLKNSVKIN